jgi:hypothetical protein
MKVNSYYLEVNGESATLAQIKEWISGGLNLDANGDPVYYSTYFPDCIQLGYEADPASLVEQPEGYEIVCNSNELWQGVEGKTGQTRFEKSDFGMFG